MDEQPATEEPSAQLTGHTPGSIQHILSRGGVVRDTGDTPKIKRRPRGSNMSSIMRKAVVGSRVSFEVPGNIFDAYNAHCAKNGIDRADGCLELAHKLARNLIKNPETILITPGEDETLSKWAIKHGIRHPNVRIHNDTVKLLQEAAEKTNDPNMSLRQLACRTMLNLLEGSDMLHAGQ